MTTFEAVSGPFDFGRVVQRTFRVIGDNFALFAVGGLLLVAGPMFFATLAALNARQAGALFPMSTFVGILASAIGSLLMQGAMTYAAIQRLNGREVSFGQVASVGLRFFFPLLGLAILQFLGVMLGYLLFIVPGVILSIIWIISAPSLVIEERGVTEAMQRSRDLTRGHRWAIFGLCVVYIIVSMVLGTVVTAVSAAAGVGAVAAAGGLNPTGDVTPVLVVTTFIQALINGAQSMLAAAGVASIYYELRVTKEGAAPQDLASVFD